MSWSTNSTKIAATFAGLGFKITSSMTEIIELRSFKNLRFFVSDTSLLFPALPQREHLYRGWMDGTLVKLDSTHPFICGMHACHSYDALLDYQARGTRYALKLVNDTPLYRYELGEEDPRLKLAAPAHGMLDLPLAAALALEGLPVIDIDGAPPRRRYLLPDQTLASLAGVVALGSMPTVTELLARKEPGKLPLRIGTTHRGQPVVSGYNVARSYARLLSDINRLKKKLLIKDPFSDRRAIIPETPSKKLEDEVQQHFRVA